MDVTALREGKRLKALRLQAQTGTEFVKGATNACGSVPVLEPTHGTIPWLDAAMVLL